MCYWWADYIKGEFSDSPYSFALDKLLNYFYNEDMWKRIYIITICLCQLCLGCYAQAITNTSYNSKDGYVAKQEQKINERVHILTEQMLQQRNYITLHPNAVQNKQLTEKLIQETIELINLSNHTNEFSINSLYLSFLNRFPQDSAEYTIIYRMNEILRKHNYELTDEVIWERNRLLQTVSAQIYSYTPKESVTVKIVQQLEQKQVKISKDFDALYTKLIRSTIRVTQNDDWQAVLGDTRTLNIIYYQNSDWTIFYPNYKYLKCYKNLSKSQKDLINLYIALGCPENVEPNRLVPIKVITKGERLLTRYKQRYPTKYVDDIKELETLIEDMKQVHYLNTMDKYMYEDQ